MAWEAAGANRVDTIAAGNEPQVSDGKAANIRDTLKGEEWLKDALDLTDEQSRVFQVGDILLEPADSHDPWAVQEIFEAGIINDSLAKYAAEHYYQGAGAGRIDTTAKLQRLLMNHTATTKVSLPRRAKSISYLKSHFPNVPYIISEWGDTLDGTINMTTCFGAALWAVDYDLAAMSHGAARVEHTGGPCTAHTMWGSSHLDQGVNKGDPNVRAVFSATAFVADFIGSASTPGVVTEIDEVENGTVDFLSAYAIYDEESSGPSRVALLNMKLWDDSETAAREITTFMLPVSTQKEQVKVRRLVAESGATAMGLDVGGIQQNVTWAGEQWSKVVDNGRGHFEKGVVEMVDVVDGKVGVVVREPEAVIVDF